MADTAARAAGTGISRRRTRLAVLGSLARRKPLGAFGAVVVIVLITMAVFAPFVAPYPPLKGNSLALLQPPSLSHLAGTDQFGRDVFSRIVFGARTSLEVSTAVTVVSLIPALVLGLCSAYYGGWLDYLVGRIVDTIQALPPLVLLITIMVVLGPSLVNVIFALSFRRAVTESRIIRAAAFSVTNQVYLEAARGLGATTPRILLRYLLPNVMPTVIVLAAVGFAGVIVAEASLSFLGYGVPPPAPSWGGMLAKDGRAYMFSAPWMLFGPTGALAVVVFGVNLFGDALRDVLDPRLRGS